MTVIQKKKNQTGTLQLLLTRYKRVFGFRFSFITNWEQNIINIKIIVKCMIKKHSNEVVFIMNNLRI